MMSKAILPWFGGDVCEPIEHAVYKNITLRNINITGPRTSLGTIIGDYKTPIRDIVFDNVFIHPCSSSSRGHSRIESFPGLLQPIEDPEVTSFYLILAAATIVPVIFVSCCCWFR